MYNKYMLGSLIFLGYATYSYNRKAVSFCIIELLSSGLQNSHVGLILSSQNLAYAISKFLGGVLSDYLSAKILFSSGLLLSGLATLAFASSSSVEAYTVAWFFNGLSQGFGWPAIAKLLNSWFKPDELGTWWSLTSSSTNFVGCIAPFFARYLIDTFSWRYSLIFAGTISLAVGGFCQFFMQDSPEDLKKSSKKKSKSETKDRKSETTQLSEIQLKGSKKNVVHPSPLLFLLKQPTIILLAIVYSIISCVKTSLTDWSQIYLTAECGLSQLLANSFLSSFEFGGFLGGILAGYLSDILTKRLLQAKDTSKRNQSKLFTSFNGHPRMFVALCFALGGASSLYFIAFRIDKQAAGIFVTTMGFLLGVAVYGQIAIYGIVASQAVPKEMSGSSHAIVALAANIGSILAGLPFASLAKHYSWSWVFMLLEFVSVLIIVVLSLSSKSSYKIDLLPSLKNTTRKEQKSQKEKQN